MENNLKNQHYKNMSIKPQMEILTFEAESVAYVVCQHFGIDTADYSFGYVAGWSHGKNLSQLKASLELIRNTAAELIDGIDPPKELPPPTQKKQRTKRRNAYERS